MKTEKMINNIFISHSSEEKELIALPLYNYLDELDLNPWIDKKDIQVSDSLFSKINEGIRKARSYVIIISPSFINNSWTKKELKAIFTQHTEKNKKIFIILHELDINVFKDKYPLLSDSVIFEASKKTLKEIAYEIGKIIKKSKIDLKQNKILQKKNKISLQKAKNLSQLIKVFNPNLHLDETQHQFFVNIFGKELDRLVTEIIHAPNNQIFFITGQSGNGKTSMLRNLQKEYPNELKEFRFLYLDGRDLINIENLKIEDVMYKIAKKIEPSENISKNIDIDTLNKMINSYENKVLKGKKRLVLIIDDFEKIVITDLNKTEDAYYKFLFEGIPSLRYLNCIKLITFPFHHKNRALVEDAVFKDFIVHLDDNGSLDIDKIQQVILKRLEDTTLISDLPYIIKNSGANMRQLIQLVHKAGSEAQTAKGVRIDKDEIEKSIRSLQLEFAELIEKDLEFYQYVHKHKNIDFQNEQHRALLTSALRNRTVFAYLFENRYYYALNPVVAKLLEKRSKPKFFEM